MQLRTNAKVWERDKVFLMDFPSVYNVVQDFPEEGGGVRAISALPDLYV